VNNLEAFRAARREFESRVASVSSDQLALPTPCDNWDVHTLIDHIIAGDTFATRVLGGATVADAVEGLIGADAVGDDALASVRAAAEALDVSFSAEGSMERVIHHPVGDIPGHQFLDFRTMDYTGHAWDLARATGQDETLDPDLVASLLSRIDEYTDMLSGSEHFGGGTSGGGTSGGGTSGGDQASAQLVLLDAMGRRA
jgi:uncharacterized protein (TIGR03086 family)